MKTSYPTSYPYSNKYGLVFTGKTLNLVAEYIMVRKMEKAENLGLELAYAMRWAMEVATDHLHFIKLVFFLFKRLTKRGYKREKLGEKVDILLDRILDPDTEMLEGGILRKIDVERVIGPPEEVSKIANLRARDRKTAIEKLKRHWEGD